MATQDMYSLFIWHHAHNIATSLCDYEVHLYADDNIIYCFTDSALQTIVNLQFSFSTLQDALIHLKLWLNTNKT